MSQHYQTECPHHVTDNEHCAFQDSLGMFSTKSICDAGEGTDTQELYDLFQQQIPPEKATATTHSARREEEWTGGGRLTKKPQPSTYCRKRRLHIPVLTKAPSDQQRLPKESNKPESAPRVWINWDFVSSPCMCVCGHTKPTGITMSLHLTGNE